MKTRSNSSLKKVAVAAFVFFLSAQTISAYSDYEVADTSIKYQAHADNIYKKELFAGTLNMAIIDMVATGRKVEERANYLIQKVMPSWLNVDTQLSYNKVNVGFAYKF